MHIILILAVVYFLRGLFRGGPLALILKLGAVYLALKIGLGQLGDFLFAPYQ